nr:phosphoglycerate dehydrogenase [candidate division Zixibacteria bacterium]NIU14080.1 phosphoglycerate dehydrogenase [candidate division Zixibacteria bacterium]NIW44897.1 phosphoglycerate dehydrogenase [Gammaproteobacteria bacterium]
MAEWKVLLTDGLKETGKDLFENRAELDDRNGISAEELLTVIGEFDGVIVRGRTKMTREVIQRADKLKVIGRAGVGVDNIDLAAAQSASITVVNSPIASTQAVAEYTIALMLSVLRNIPRADHDMKSGFWNKKKLAGQELSGKTLGIIGLGRIGSSVAQLAGAFGMELIGHDPFLTYEDIQDKRVRPVDIGEVYAQADLITIHVPLSP